MKIKVTNYEIGMGSRNNSYNCPIALALKSKGYKQVKVNYGYIELENKFIDLPIEAKSFMLAFDTYERVRPFEFNLNMQN